MIFYLIPLIVGTVMRAHPDLEGSVLEQQIDSDLRHATRAALGPAGFLADVLWDFAPVHDQVRQAIANDIAAVQLSPLGTLNGTVTQTANSGVAPGQNPEDPKKTDSPQVPPIIFVPPATSADNSGDAAADGVSTSTGQTAST